MSMAMNDFAAAVGYLVMGSAGLAIAIGCVWAAFEFACKKLGVTQKVYRILRDNARAERDRTGA